MKFNEFILTFIPLFVAIDALGSVPAFLSLTDGISALRRKALVRDACLTALAVSLLFLVGGRWVFRVLGVLVDDFRVAGGIVLLILAVNDMLFSRERKRVSEDTVGIVPIGVPLIIGPAALTTLLILVDSHGYAWTLVSLFLNLLIVWGIYGRSQWISRRMGPGVSRAFAKIMALLLAAIAVMMIRVGLTGILLSHGLF